MIAFFFLVFCSMGQSLGAFIGTKGKFFFLSNLKEKLKKKDKNKEDC
jgi:hypothetical protein